MLESIIGSLKIELAEVKGLTIELEVNNNYDIEMIF